MNTKEKLEVARKREQQWELSDIVDTMQELVDDVLLEFKTGFGDIEGRHVYNPSTGLTEFVSDVEVEVYIDWVDVRGEKFDAENETLCYVVFNGMQKVPMFGWSDDDECTTDDIEYEYIDMESDFVILDTKLNRRAEAMFHLAISFIFFLHFSIDIPFDTISSIVLDKLYKIEKGIN